MDLLGLQTVGLWGPATPMASLFCSAPCVKEPWVTLWRGTFCPRICSVSSIRTHQTNWPLPPRARTLFPRTIFSTAFSPTSGKKFQGLIWTWMETASCTSLSPSLHVSHLTWGQCLCGIQWDLIFLQSILLTGTSPPMQHFQKLPRHQSIPMHSVCFWHW